MNETAAIIVAGGMGTRMAAGQDAPPKSLIDIGGKPLLEHQLLWIKGEGFSRVHLCLGYKAERIADYLSRHPVPGLELSFHVEETPRGTAGGVLDAAGETGSAQDLLVVYGDLFVEMDSHRLLDFHAKHQGAATLAVCATDHPWDSDLIRLAGNRVAGFYRAQKGETSENWAGAAVWVLRRPILDLIPSQGLSDFGRDVFPEALRRGLPLYAYRTDEPLLDLGTPQRLANFLKRRLAAKASRRPV